MASFDLHGVSNMSQFFSARQDLFKAQEAMARITNQISSNQQFSKPSEDIGASSRVIRLQAILEQYETFSNSIEMGSTKLETVDSVLSEANALIINLKAQALDMSDSTSSAAERLATAEVVQQSLSSLVGLANSSVADQFLFSGFDSSQPPFKIDGDEVVFLGDSNEITTQISQGQYLATTLNPNEAFGTLSVEKKGTADLNPRLNFGQGSVDGHSVTAAGTSTTFTDSSLVTSGFSASDLVGREVYVSSGTNSGEHGTITGYGAGVVTIDGADAFTAAFDTTSVFSISRGTAGTSLESLNKGAGVQAGEISISSAGVQKKINLSTARTITDVKERIENTFSNLTVSINAAGSGLTVTDTALGSLTISSVNGGTTAEDLKINGTAAGGVLPAAASDLNVALTENTRVADLDGAATQPLPTLGSIHVINGTRTANIDLSSATTVREMLKLVNTATTSDGRPMYLEASINTAGTGLNVMSRLSGADFSISNISGADSTATELGLLTMTSDMALSTLRQGKGLDFDTGTDMIIRVGSGGGATDYNIDFSTSPTPTTIADLIARISSETGGAVTASIDNITGNNMQLASTNAVDMISVTTVNSNVAAQMGFSTVPQGTDGVATTLSASVDVAALEVDSVFTSVINLSNGLMNNDSSAIQFAAQDVENSLDTLLSGRAKVGGRLVRLDLTSTLIENQKLFAQEDLSRNFDVDLTEALTELSARQVALEATLATTARILDTSLLNFI